MAVKKIKVLGSNNSVANSSVSSFNIFQANASTVNNIGTFLVTTNTSSRVINNTNELTSFSKSINLDSLNLTQEQMNSVLNTTTEFTINQDNSNLLSFAKYGSLFERFKASIVNIINTFPGSLYINGFIDDYTTYNTVNNYNYNNLTNTSTFYVNRLYVTNNFNLNINNSSDNNDINNSDLKNLPLSYNKYVVYYNGNEYELNGFTGLTSTNNTQLFFSVVGNPFSGLTNGGSGSYIYHIKPETTEYSNFYSNLDYFEKYLLNKDSVPQYTITIQIPLIDEENDVIIYNEKSYTWTTSDGYNIDINNTSFNNYYNDLIQVCNDFDSVKTDLVNRMLMTSSVLITDTTTNFKSQQFSRILGREIDEIKRYVDGISFVNNITYDKIENVSDSMVKSLATTLGFESFNFIETDDLFASIFNSSVSNVNGTGTASKTPAELDIELWRTILINTNYLFKSKGTRKGIEAIFSLLGLPDSFIEINEYVYTVDGVINPNTVDLTSIYPLNEDLTKLPFDSNGYPVSPNEIPTFYFQISGNTDSGQHYIDVYRKLGFNVTKQIDNKKTWVYSTGTTNHFDDFTSTVTDYDVNDSRLIINTKELSIYLDPIQAIEDDIYNYNKQYNYPISSTGRTYPYPNRASNKFSVTGLTFNQYISESYKNFINAQNRKTIKSDNGINYPSLYKLYEDYLLANNSNKYTVSKINNFIGKFQNLYNKLITQLLSATVIIGENGIKIKNLPYTEQKFDYKNGIDVSSEFQNTQPPFLDINLKSVTSISGNYNKQLVNNTYLFQSYGNASFTGNKGGSGNPSDTFIKLQDIVNVDTRFTYNILDLTIPTFNINGATKIGSLPSNNSVYYYDTISSGQTLTFNFTSGVSVLNTSGNTFNFDMYELNKTTKLFDTLDLTVNTTSATFSGGSTFIQTINKNILSGDTEYIIKPYYTYNTNLLTGSSINYTNQLDSFNLANLLYYPLNQQAYTYYFDNINYSGYTYSTRNNGYDLQYGNYNKDSDYYFVSVKSPETPQLSNNQNITTQPLGTLFTEQLTPDTGGTFMLSYQPDKDIILSLNGSVLVKNIEYSGYTTLPQALNDITFQLLVPYNTTYDTLTASYVVNSAKNSLLLEQNYINYTIPTGTSRTNVGRLYYDNTTGYYSYNTDLNLSVNANNIYVTYNGNTLVPFSDFDFTQPNKIVFNNIVSLSGDTINVAYANPSGSIISMNTPTQSIEWNVNSVIPANETGLFILEFSNDASFSTIISSGSTPYVQGQSIYSITVDLTTAPWNTLSYNSSYFGRIVSTRYFTTVDNKQIPVTSYSSNFILETP